MLQGRCIIVEQRFPRDSSCGWVDSMLDHRLRAEGAVRPQASRPAKGPPDGAGGWNRARPLTPGLLGGTSLPLWGTFRPSWPGFVPRLWASIILKHFTSSSQRMLKDGSRFTGLHSIPLHLPPQSKSETFLLVRPGKAACCLWPPRCGAAPTENPGEHPGGQGKEGKDMEGGCRAICVDWVTDLGAAPPAFLPSAWGDRQLICPPEGLHTTDKTGGRLSWRAAQSEGCTGSGVHQPDLE